MELRDNESEARLETLLERTVSETRSDFPDILERINKRFDISLFQICRSKPEFSNAVWNEKPLNALSRGWVQLAGNGNAVDPHVLPSALLRRVLLGSSVQSVLHEFREFAESRSSGAVWYAALAGVSVSEPISLDDGVEVVPWDLVPDSSAGKKFLEFRQADPMSGLKALPNCAIKISLPNRRVFFENAMQTEDPLGSLSEISRCHDIGADIQRALTLTSQKQVGFLVTWTQATNSVANEFAGSAIAHSRGADDSGLFSSSLQPVLSNPTETRTTLQKLTVLKAKEQAAIRTAIDRLSASWIWKSLTDQAIDLGISLEVLLLHDNQPDRGELKYRFSVRGAKILGGSGIDQLDRFRKLKAIYDLRSKAVHAGSIEQSEETRLKLVEAQGLCVRIANEILNLGRFPDWEKDLIFSD